MNFQLKYITGLLLLTVIVLSGCKKEEEVDTKQVEHDRIKQYAEDNNLNGYFTESGLYYAEVEEGDGEHPNINSKIAVEYNAYSLNGVLLDESDYFTSKLENLIPAWQEGIPLMRDNGKAILISPSHLAYNDGIWKFEVTLFSFSK